MRIGRIAAVAVLIASLTLTAGGCAPERDPRASPSPTATPSATPVPSPTLSPSRPPSPSPSPTATAPDPLAGMSLRERVAQLFMVGTGVDRVDRVTLSAVADRHIGGVFLRGRSHAGVAATASLVRKFTARLPASAPPLWVATDQEGGKVQVLSGEGFRDIPSALAQARSGCGTLDTRARRWGRELAAAGVTMNLAPVVDIVTSAKKADDNPPIGRLDRQYGFDEATVTACAGAVARGMRRAGILPTFKHFPGLGRTTANTDFSRGVTDTEVTASSPDVDVYRTLLPRGSAVVMVSTAVYERIDPSAPAAFSPDVVTGLLRRELGFDGVVMTDDISATAQVERWRPGTRAILAIRAGVDLLLVSADANVFPPMYRAVLRKARTDPAFAAQVDAAARRIVELKNSFPPVAHR